MDKQAFASMAMAMAVVAAGCGSSAESSGDTLAVAASFYPVAEAADRVGGSRAVVTNLTPPGTGPHDLELSTDAAASLEDADVVFYLGSNFQPEVEEAIAGLDGDIDRADLLESIELRPVDDAVPGVVGEVDGEVLEGRKDPHAWVDPATFTRMVEQVRDAYIDRDPDGRDTYEANAETYLDELRELDGAFSGGLSSCESRVLVTSHAAFGYLTDRYDLVQAPIAGISPAEEPDPKSLAATAAFAKANGVTTVFFETLVPKDLAVTVADEIGATTDALDPVEGIPQNALDDGGTYLSIQEDNLDRLVKGLRCTKE